MKYIDSTGSVNNRFVDKDLPMKKKGTYLTAEWLNIIQDEIVQAITGHGITLSSANSHQLLDTLKLIRTTSDNKYIHNSSSNKTAQTIKGDLAVTGTLTETSDRRVKANFELIENALDKVTSLNGYTYTRTDREDTEKRYTGVVAQEVKAVLPEAVIENADGQLSVAYTNMMGIMIEAIKELTLRVQELESK